MGELTQQEGGTMSTPTVTEITRRPEPVAHDTFVDDITRVPGRPASDTPLRGGRGERTVRA
jgi:hypothetical protein